MGLFRHKKPDLTEAIVLRLIERVNVVAAERDRAQARVRECDQEIATLQASNHGLVAFGIGLMRKETLNIARREALCNAPIGEAYLLPSPIRTENPDGPA